jgi:hypothetical protein
MLALPTSGCLAEAYDNREVASLPSPDGRHRAVLFERSCGATTGFSTQVSILRTGERLKDGGNAFIANGRGEPAPWGGPWADVRWRSDGRLVIRHDPTASIYKAAKEVDGVHVAFAPEPPPSRPPPLTR